MPICRMKSHVRFRYNSGQNVRRARRSRTCFEGRVEVSGHAAMPSAAAPVMTSNGVYLGVSCGTTLADVYANLLSDAADALSVSSDGSKVLVLPAGLIQSAAFQQGVADGYSLQTVANNARILADIGAYCNAHNIGVAVDAVLTPPAAGGFYTGPGAVNEYIHAWATAAAVAALPIISVEDIQEVGTEDAYALNGITSSSLASVAASEALAVNTLVTTYRQIASDASSGNIAKMGADAALPKGISFVAADDVTLANELTLIARACANSAANLTVGDMEAGGGADTNSVLQDVAQFWNAYDSIANSATVELYGSWQNAGGQLKQVNGSLGTQDPGAEISNATTVWINGTIVNQGAFNGIINPGTITQTGSIYSWVASNGTLPAGWVPPAGTPSTPLYEILQSGSVYTYVYEQSVALTLSNAQRHFSFVTSDTGTGTDWREWLQGVETLASGGTIQALGTTISIGSNPTLALNVLAEPYGPAVTATQVVQEAEQQAFMLAGFGVPIDNLVNEVWSNAPVGSGLINDPSSWTHAEAEIAALNPLYTINSITAEGFTGVTIAAPGQIVLQPGSAAFLGRLFLGYSAPDSATARLGVVVVDLNGTFALANASSPSGTFGSSGTFSGAGSNILVLNGTTADLAMALKTIVITAGQAGPDTIDIETYGTSGILSDNQISVFATNSSTTADVVTTNAPDWAMSSSTINQGTIVSETLHWDASVGPVPAGLSADFVKTDRVLKTLSDYDVLPSSGGMANDGSLLVASPYNGSNNPALLSYFGGLGLVAQMGSLTVSTTVNTFDAAGYLAQSVDVLVAPQSTNGVDDLTLLPWGQQITSFNVPGNTQWNSGTNYSSQTLTLNAKGQTVEALLQGGPSGPGNMLDEIFDPDNGTELWEEIQATTAYSSSGSYPAFVPTVVTEFNTGDNPFWDKFDWGTGSGAIAIEIYGNGMSVPLNAISERQLRRSYWQWKYN